MPVTITPCQQTRLEITKKTKYKLEKEEEKKVIYNQGENIKGDISFI